MFRVHTLAKGSGVIQCANSTCIHFQFSWWIDSSHDLGTGTASVRIAPASAACLRASVEAGRFDTPSRHSLLIFFLGAAAAAGVLGEAVAGMLRGRAEQQHGAVTAVAAAIQHAVPRS